MQIEVIATGDEVLTGFTVDTNSAWLCQRLLEHGWQIRRRHAVGDRMDDLVAILQERGAIADLIIINGGLGPTSDDKTTEAAALAAGVSMTLRSEWLALLQARFAARGRSMPESNTKQAMLPDGAEIIPNPIGTACGFSMQIGKARCFFTPGVPGEFKRMVLEQILPTLDQHNRHGHTRVQRYFTFGVSESALSDRLDTLNWPAHLDLGYRSSMPTIELKLISQQADQTDFAAAEAQLLQVIQPFMVARDELDVPAELAKLLSNQRLHVIEQGSAGLVQAKLAPAIPHLTGELKPLPRTAPALLHHVQGAEQLTLAVGPEQDGQTSIALWTGQAGVAQTLKVTIQDPALRRGILAFAAQDMLRRHLHGEDPLGPYETLIRCAEYRIG